MKTSLTEHSAPGQFTMTARHPIQRLQQDSDNEQDSFEKILRQIRRSEVD